MTVAYSVPPALIAGLAVVSAASFAVAARSAPGGRFLFGVLAVVSAAEALRAALLRPTLAADERGLAVVTGLRRERHPWPAVAAVSVMGPPGAGGRFRRRANAVEIDLGERLLVVPGYRLGAPVGDVVAALTALRAARNGS